MQSIAEIGPVFAPTPSPRTGRTPAVASRLVFRECLGSRRLPSGSFALRLLFLYRSERGLSYRIEVAPELVLSPNGRYTYFTGVSYVRNCTCPDHTKRRGAAAPHSRERLCKHMQLVSEVVATWAGRPLERPEWVALSIWPEAAA